VVPASRLGGVGGFGETERLVRTRSCALSFEVPAPSFEWIVGNPAVKLPMSGALFALQGHCVLRQGQGLPPPLRSGQVSLDEAERFTAQSTCQRRYAPMVFRIIPECRSASLRN